MRARDRGLEGIAVGIPATRRAAETAALIVRQGGTPVVGPTLREVPTTDDAALRGATEDVVRSRPRWSIHLTGVGTRRWFDAAEGWGVLAELLDALHAAGVVARGGKSTAALRARGIEPTWIPSGETSEEIAAWLVPQLVSPVPVVLQMHGGRPPPLKGALVDAGVRLIEVVPYRWELPADLGPARDLVTKLVKGEIDALVVTSAPQIHFLFEIARGMAVDGALKEALKTRVFIGAVGSVAARGVTDEGLSCDHVADPPRMGALARALAQSRDRILAKARRD